jgi:hypothetical protein
MNREQGWNALNFWWSPHSWVNDVSIINAGEQLLVLLLLLVVNHRAVAALCPAGTALMLSCLPLRCGCECICGTVAHHTTRILQTLLAASAAFYI